MAYVAEKVVVELEAANDRFDARMARTAGAQQTNMRTIERASANMERAVANDLTSLSKRYEELGAGIGRSLQRASRVAQVAFAGIVGYGIKLAADAAEIESAFDVAFKNMAGDARAFADVLADKVGRDAVELREKMTRLQLVLTGTGVAAAQALDLTKALTTAGIDAGSLFNTSDAEAMQKIISGISGEAEPLKAFGVVLTETATKAELLRLGFKGNAEGASEAAKSIARANLILKGLAVAQGDAERTAGSAANQTKKLTAEFNQAARELGEQLLPTFVKVAGVATDVLKAFNDLPGGFQVAGLAVLGFIAAGGPIAGLLANLGKVIALARDTRLALLGLTGAEAAAGAAGLAGGAKGRVVGGLVGVAGAIGLGTAGANIASGARGGAAADRFDQTKGKGMTDAELATALAYTKSNSMKTGAKFLAEQITDEIQRRAKTTPASSAGASSGAVLSGFSLPDALKTGGGKAGASPKGTKADPIAITQVQSETPYDLKTGRQLDSTDPETRFLDLMKTIEAGLNTENPYQGLAQPDSLQGPINAAADAAEKALYESTYSGIRGALQAAADGDILDYFANAAGQALLDSAAKGLAEAFLSAGGGGSGMIASAGRALLGIPGFATGTSSAPGGLAYVHKDELVNLPRGSSVIPKSQTQAMLNRAGSGGGNVNINVDVSGANGDAAVEAIARRAAAQGARQAIEVSRRGAAGVQTRLNLLGTP